MNLDPAAEAMEQYRGQIVTEAMLVALSRDVANAMRDEDAGLPKVRCYAEGSIVHADVTLASGGRICFTMRPGAIKRVAQ